MYALLVHFFLLRIRGRTIKGNRLDSICSDSFSFVFCLTATKEENKVVEYRLQMSKKGTVGERN
jgi:hypothetical protein